MDDVTYGEGKIIELNTPSNGRRILETFFLGMMLILPEVAIKWKHITIKLTDFLLIVGSTQHSGNCFQIL